MTPELPVTRRKLLSGVATLGVVSLAGCMGARGDGSSESSSSESIHWHIDLGIEINGEPYPIPKNVGIGSQYSDSPYFHSSMQMTSIHTHDDSGTLHWEISAHYPKDGELTMLVNGSSNDQFDGYRVQDGDNILIRFK